MPPEPVDVVPLLSAARRSPSSPGKGGVGKTTVTAVLARAAADAGRRVLAVELDGKPTLAELVGDVPLLALSAPRALEEYLREHGFGRVAKRLAASGVIDVVSTAAPGIDDLVVLGKIKQLERSGDWDSIVVDGPAAGHAVTMLTSAAGPARRRAQRAGASPGRRRAGDARRPRALPGRPRHAARDDPGQRDGRDRVHARGPRRRASSAPVFVNAVDGRRTACPIRRRSTARRRRCGDADAARAPRHGSAASAAGVQRSAIDRLAR